MAVSSIFGAHGDLFGHEMTNLAVALAQAAGSAARVLSMIPHMGLQQLQAATSLFISPRYSMLSIQSDLAGWVLDQETVELQRVVSRLGLDARINRGISPYAAQCCHYASQGVLLKPRHFKTRNRVSIDFFHGLPGTTEAFTEMHHGLRRHHETISRVRVSHSRMERVVLESGIDPDKVRRIPIGVNLAYFEFQTAASRLEARRRLNLPQSAVILGSFQKDGVGWGEGLEPKDIKGPDVFLKAVSLLKLEVPELYVLLSGPARGFVKAGLERIGVPYTHLYLKNYGDIGQFYQALDLYLIASREEGGPKAVLEAMASGVPLVTTKVGQAMDLIRHGENAWVVDVEDADGLAHWAEHVLSHQQSKMISEALKSGRKTAEANSYESQIPLWRSYMQGFFEGGVHPR